MNQFVAKPKPTETAKVASDLNAKPQPALKTIVFDGDNPAYREINAKITTYNPS